MEEQFFTLGVWKVKPGYQEEFIAAWKTLSQVFAELPHPPGKGRLIQSISDPDLFYSFGPWNRLEDIQEMRGSAKAQDGIRRLMELCTEATPGAFRLAAETK